MIGKALFEVTLDNLEARWGVGGWGEAFASASVQALKELGGLKENHKRPMCLGSSE